MSKSKRKSLNQLHRTVEFKFGHTNKWYMLNPEPLPENETHKLLWNFEIQMDHLISARQPDLVIVNKKESLPNCRLWLTIE